MAGKSAPGPSVVQPKERLDKWLHRARFFRSRGLAAAILETGHCRVNGQRVGKAGHFVGPGDVLTFPQGNRIRLIRILDLAERRGPATEAAALYVDLDVAVSPLE